MAYNDFSLQDVIDKFEINLLESTFCDSLPPATPQPEFLTIFQQSLPLAQRARSEKAKSELLVSPILVEVRRLIGDRIQLFSGEEFNVDRDQEQIEYYRERASEYDEWFFRPGRYDRGEAHRKQWFAEIAEVEQLLRTIQPSGDILELACGTGLWTQHLVSLATHVTAVDASPEVIDLNRTRVNSKSVEYIIADLFNWTPNQKFDMVFFGFWLSHVPMERFVYFWQMVKDSLKPNGRVFFVDSLFDPTSPAINHATIHKDGYSERKLNDGRVYQVVKIFYEPTQLEKSLQELGWFGRIHSTPTHFIYGSLYPIKQQV